MTSLRGLLSLVFLTGAVVVSACGEDPPATALQPLDFEPVKGEKLTFDRNAVVDSAAFTDVQWMDVSTVQAFLDKTPYQRASFLSTYQSNGVRAADAIINVARQHRVNPLVFLVFAQTTQGLVGERTYPFPPDRIEYVFRCGCLHANDCLTTFAGFDRQLDCLGRALRTAIDEIQANEETTSGWGPNIASTTLDNLKVTPANDATAALYDRIPRVAEGQAGGTWVFWNVWNHYAAELGYVGPIGSSDGRWIGEPCVTAAMCSGVQGAICADNYPDGLCTVPCTGSCPTSSSRPASFCAKFADGGYCLPICNPQAPTCRQGYRCARVVGVGSDAVEAEHVCAPDPDTDG